MEEIEKNATISSVFSSRYYQDLIDDDPWWLIHTEELFQYIIYYDEIKDVYDVILYTTIIETDDKGQETREEKRIEKTHNPSVLYEIELFKESKKKIKQYFTDNVYFELMDKSLHPDRFNWFI